MASGPIITEDLIVSWESRLAETRLTIQRFEENAVALVSLISAGRQLLQLDNPEPPPAEKLTLPKAPPRAAAKRSLRKRHAKPKSWGAAMMEVINAAPGALTYQELRAQMQVGSANDREWSEKSFYGTMGKLHDNKTLVRYKGRVFSIAAFEKFEMDVLSGAVADFEESVPTRQPSALSKFFMGTIANQPIGLTSGQLIAAAQQNPEVAEAVGKNKTFPYNVLKALVEKGDIVKADGLYYPVFNNTGNNGPVIDAPQYLKDLYDSQPAGYGDKYTGGIADEH